MAALLNGWAEYHFLDVTQQIRMILFRLFPSVGGHYVNWVETEKIHSFLLQLLHFFLVLIAE